MATSERVYGYQANGRRSGRGFGRGVLGAGLAASAAELVLTPRPSPSAPPRGPGRRRGPSSASRPSSASMPEPLRLDPPTRRATPRSAAMPPATAISAPARSETAPPTKPAAEPTRPSAPGTQLPWPVSSTSTRGASRPAVSAPRPRYGAAPGSPRRPLARDSRAATRRRAPHKGGSKLKACAVLHRRRGASIINIMTMTVRLGQELEEALEALAWATHKPKSEILRRALTPLLDAELSAEDLEAWRASRPSPDEGPPPPSTPASPPPVRIARPGEGKSIGRRWSDSRAHGLTRPGSEGRSGTRVGVRVVGRSVGRSGGSGRRRVVAGRGVG